ASLISLTSPADDTDSPSVVSAGLHHRALEPLSRVRDCRLPHCRRPWFGTSTLGEVTIGEAGAAGQRCFSIFGEVSNTPVGHSAPRSIHARSSATSSVVSAGNLSRTALGGISESGTLPDTYSINGLFSLCPGTMAAAPDAPPCRMASRLSRRKWPRGFSPL